MLGSFFIIALYHVSIFVLRRDDRSSLYLAAGCVLLASRVVMEGFYAARWAYPEAPYTLVRRLDYMTFIWGPVFFGWLNYTLLPGDVDRRVLKAFGVIGAASTLYVWLTPAEVFGESGLFDPIIVAEMGYCLYAVLMAAVRKREDSPLLLVSGVILTLSIMHDILYNADVLGEMAHLGQLYAYGFLAYLYLYSFVLAKRFAKSFRDARKLSDELSDALVQLEASIKARIDSELGFLRMQIKPHFLYNTLSMISSLITREPERAKELLLDLSDYLRGSYRFESRDGLIDLDEELRLVELYLKLVRARYKDRFGVVLDVDESIRMQVPMLIIQPLVENAVTHGVFDMLEGGVVEIAVKSGQDCVAISVRDNGKGMTQSKVDSVLAGADDGSGVGISNINRRLMREYGQGLKIESSPGRGTTVEIRIPRKEMDAACL